MSIVNRQIVIDAWKAFASRDASQIEPFFSENAEWIAPQGNATAIALGCTNHMIGREAISGFIANDFGRLFVSDVDIEFKGVFADGDTVIVEERMRAELVNGNHYDNDYCFVFTLHAGAIMRVREYMDTLKGQRMVFGEQPEGQIV